MHNYVMPDSVRARALKVQGKPHGIDTIEAAKTALVVIDMQNHYVGEGFPAEAASARDIVPAINTIARAMREAGGTVIWIQTTAEGARERWRIHHTYKLSPEGAERRLKSLAEDGEGFKLFAGLETSPTDLRVKKIKYSAMIPGSSDLPDVLARHGIEVLLIAGTKTNICCETTARDASMLEYRVVMLSNATAATNDEEHGGALNNFQISFGDVLSTQEVIGRLVPVTASKHATTA